MRKALTTIALFCSAAIAAAAPSGVSGLLDMLPGSSTVVVAVDVAALRTQPLVQTWLLEHSAPWSGVDEETASFLADAGLDPFRDVDLMVVAVSDGDHDDPLALFSGRYDASSLKAALLKRGAVETSVAGHPALRLEEHGHQHSAGTAPLMAISDDLLIVGSEASLASALTAGPHSPAMVTECVGRGQIELSAPFWMVVDVPETLREASKRTSTQSDAPEVQAVSGLVQATASVRRVAMFARVSDLLEIRSTATATSDENAELLHDAVKGVLAAARLQVQERHPEVVDVLRKVRVVTDGATVSVSGSVPIALLQKLAESGDVRRSTEL